MNTVGYAPLIKDMTWSYSRARSFDDCPYRWYLKYILFPRKKWDEMFFASYGGFIHKLIDQHYKEGLTPQQMTERYLSGFLTEVCGKAPNPLVFDHYFTSGLKYMQEFEPIPFEPIDTELEVHFCISDIPLVGFIDYVGKEENNLVIVDNKSRALKERSKRAKPTRTDEELDEYLKQLYLYSVAVEEKYGKLPSWLCFNCFRTQTFIKEPFDETAFAKAKEWFVDKVAQITEETKFRPNVEWFKCQYLCECRDFCEYFDLATR